MMPENPRRLENAGLSDLFFNHDHSTYHDLFKMAPTEGPGDDEQWKAIRDEAVDFAGMLASATGFVFEPDALAEDFFARL